MRGVVVRASKMARRGSGFKPSDSVNFASAWAKHIDDRLLRGGTSFRRLIRHGVKIRNGDRAAAFVTIDLFSQQLVDLVAVKPGTECK